MDPFSILAATGLATGALGAIGLGSESFKDSPASKPLPRPAREAYGTAPETEFQRRLRERQEQVRAREAPQIQRGMYAEEKQQARETRAQTADDIELARQAAIGQGPSAAQLQYQQQADAAARQAMALAGSARGGALTQAAAQRAAVEQGYAGAAQAAQQAAQLRAQEQLAARGQLLQAMRDQRAMDLQAQGMGMEEAYRQATLEANQRALAAQQELGMLRMEGDAGEAERQARIAYERDLQGIGMEERRMQIAAAEAERQRKQQFWSGIMGMGTGLAGAGLGGMARGGGGGDSGAAVPYTPVPSTTPSGRAAPGPVRAGVVVPPSNPNPYDWNP